jgi:hypothetical protein
MADTHFSIVSQLVKGVSSSREETLTILHGSMMKINPVEVKRLFI